MSDHTATLEIHPDHRERWVVLPKRANEHPPGRATSAEPSPEVREQALIYIRMSNWVPSGGWERDGSVWKVTVRPAKS